MATTLIQALLLTSPMTALGAEPNADLLEQVRQSEAAFAKTMADRDHAAFTSFLADEAVFFGGKSVQRGKQAVADAWKPLYQGPQAPFSWAPESVEVLDSGTLGLTSGTVRDPSGQPVGTFTSIWRREKDGQWKVVFDKGCDCAPPPAPAATPAPSPRIQSPEVQSDGRVIFRFRAPNAKEVLLSLEGADRQAMRKDEQGVWTVTTEALAPDLYGYAFVVDGVGLVDPSNPAMKPNLLSSQSVVHVPGPASLPWETGAAPRGSVHRHFYRSGVVGDERELYVYTPPGYESGKATYPVLYLLHGFSDDASAWTAVGRAHVILDNLIAAGKAKPMVVAMPLGYGAPEILRGGFGSSDPKLRQRNVERFGEALLAEVVPRVEKEYRVSKDREARAIAGLSMGGGQALATGLNVLDRFAWIGAFSSAVPEDHEAAFPGLDSRANARIRLLWIACGTEDRLVDGNRKLEAWLTSKQVRHTPIETPGRHTWMLWRRNLASFASLLFR